MRLLLILLVAGAASFLIGMTANTLAALMRCHGVLIWTPLSALIFRVILIVGRNRVALMGGTILLLAPVVVVFSLGTVESWSTVGVETMPTAAPRG